MNLILGDCLDAMRAMPDCSVDAIVTDPPYGLSFMGKRWDYDVPSQEIWAECLRVLKPGGHLLSFAGTRTQHRMAVRIEDAGFEIRDMIAWVYGSGFPKSLDVSKAIDKASGVAGTFGDPKSAAHAGWIERGRMRGEEGHEGYQRPWMSDEDAVDKNARQYIGGTDAARQWSGWGTALKPALEPITVARKPLIGTVAANVLAHGTGALNIDGCRVATDWETDASARGWQGGASKQPSNLDFGRSSPQRVSHPNDAGRWPANLIHDGSEEVTDRLGDAARFFYCAKASKRDRDEGLEGFAVVRTGGMQATADGSMLTGSGNERTTMRANIHPTVKPTDLMRYLCRLVTPPGGVVLDPFMGSGSTGKAAAQEGFCFIGIERDPEYFKIAETRINEAVKAATKGPMV